MKIDFDFREAFRTEPDTRSVTQDQSAPGIAADGEAEIVAEHGPAPCRCEQCRPRQLAAPGKRRGEHQKRFARHWRAQRLE
ncbi:MAG: hypothetical protein ACXW3T_04775 [Rhodoplanes sp.]